jgi:hypothetical protein
VVVSSTWAAVREKTSCTWRPEALVKQKSGSGHLRKKKLEKELADINKEARKLKTRLKVLDRRRVELRKELGDD